MQYRPIRILLSRQKGWRMPPNTVSVTRPGPFGNPFTIAAALEAGHRDPRAISVQAFRDWLGGDGWACGCFDYEERRHRILTELSQLSGKNLACWCPLVDKDGSPVPCHADVLLELANR